MTVLVIIAGIIALVLILAAIAPKGYEVTRSITVRRPALQVYDYLRHLKNQDNFSKWVMTDPGMKKEYTGTDGMVGFVYAWDGNKKAGAGAQEIMALEEARRVDVQVRFIRPFAATAQTPFEITATTPGEASVKWTMISKMPYPMNIMLPVMNMEKLLGKDMEESLNNLKRILENQ